MKKSTKRFVLHRETIGSLNGDALSRAQGAIASAACNTASCAGTCADCSITCPITTIPTNYNHPTRGTA